MRWNADSAKAVVVGAVSDMRSFNIALDAEINTLSQPGQQVVSEPLDPTSLSSDAVHWYVVELLI